MHKYHAHAHMNQDTCKMVNRLNFWLLTRKQLFIKALTVESIDKECDFPKTRREIEWVVKMMDF